MDRTGIIVVSLCAALLVFWFFEQTKLEQTRLALQAQRQQAATNAVATAQSQPVTATATVSAGSPAPVTTPVFFINTNAAEQILVLTNGRARYTFTSRGGGWNCWGIPKPFPRAGQKPKRPATRWLH
jgi:hypothetical protein